MEEKFRELYKWNCARDFKQQQELAFWEPTKKYLLKKQNLYHNLKRQTDKQKQQQMNKEKISYLTGMIERICIEKFSNVVMKEKK